MVRSQSKENITRFVRPQLLEVKWRGSSGAERSQPWVSRPSLYPAEVWTDVFARLALVLRKRTQRFHEAHEKPPSGGDLTSVKSCAGRNRTYDLQVMSLAS